MPLKIIIVGAGLGGLGCAIALTRAGHNVEVCRPLFVHEEGDNANTSRYSNNPHS